MFASSKMAGAAATRMASRRFISTQGSCKYRPGNVTHHH